jgi:metal-responsive CopG/Arc/MetJ family transcriptional regulator
MKKRISLSLDHDVLEFIDRLAKAECMNRSQFMTQCVLKTGSVKSKDYLKMIRGENESN